MLVFARPLRQSHSMLLTILFICFFFLLVFFSLFLLACAMTISTFKLVELTAKDTWGWVLTDDS